MSTVGTKIQMFGFRGEVIAHQSSMITVRWDTGEEVTAHQGTWHQYGIHYPGVSLAKITDRSHTVATCGHGTPINHPHGCHTCEHDDARPARPVTRRPAYPLVGHRRGLRMNDLVTLASAFWITSTSRLADPLKQWEVELMDDVQADRTRPLWT